MLKEALEYLDRQSRLACAPHISKPDAEPKHVYYLDGKKMLAQPEPRSHKAFDLSPIIAITKQQCELDGLVAIWYSRHGVTMLYDENDRRDRVTMALDLSQQLKTIVSWGEQSKPYTQAQLILMLRTMFKRNMTQCPKLVECLRAIRFKTGSDTTQDIRKGKASISKTIEREVSGRDDIPDEVYFNVPIFAEPFGTMEGLIDVAIEMDAGTERFTLHPIPGTVDRQIALAEQAIGAKLAEELKDVSVLYGVA